MTQERIDTPPGYTPISLPLTSLTVLMPDGWNFNERMLASIANRGYFISRELFDADIVRLDHRRAVIQTSEMETSLFTTGLSIFYYWETKTSFKVNPSQAAFAFVDESTFKQPEGDIQQLSIGNLRIFRRHFLRPAGFYGNLPYDNRHIYIESGADDEEQVLYLARFETPTILWEQYEEVGKCLIESINYSEQD